MTRVRAGDGLHRRADDPNAAGRGGDPDTSSNPSIPPLDSKPDAAQLERVRGWLSEHKRPARQDGLWPYLLIRAFPGDTGVRSPALPVFWESPDVRVYPGDVTDPSGLAATLSPTAGQVHTVFVHVWNLGRLAAVGVVVRVWWANPSFSFDASSPEPPHFIGGASVNLGDRSQPDCHALVRVGTWTPVEENGGHECLLATAESVLDPAQGGFAASTDRHVAQRNLMLAAPTEDLTPLLERLGAVLPAGADLELLHGGRELDPILLAHGLRDPQRAFVTPKVDTGVVVADHPAAVDRIGVVRSSVLGRVPVLAGPGGGIDTALKGPPLVATRSPAVALIRALGVRDLNAGTVAQAVSSSSGDGNLLRFRAVRDGTVQGGYSVIVS
jgi:hypothetical protein